jgi:hypothetical protein
MIPKKVLPKQTLVQAAAHHADQSGADHQR